MKIVMHKFIFLLCFVNSVIRASSSDDPALSYIDKFSDIAKKEMIRTGIPASIKMAQALLESEYGKSRLALEGNNHFGIKCGRDWQGKTFYKADDDFNEEGELTESCFRSFDKPEDSFIAHSEFLADPRKKSRYGFLFALDSKDIVSWANGLKEAGYASDPGYASKLLKMIDKYNLSSLDDGQLAMVKSSSIPTGNSQKIDGSDLPIKSRLKEVEKITSPQELMFKVVYVNGVRGIEVKNEISVETLAEKIGRQSADLLAFNELLKTPSQKIIKGTFVFLEMKKRDYEGPETKHLVKEGESIESIANLYGIKAQTLYSLNHIPKSCMALRGEKLNLKENVKNNEKPKYQRKKKNEEEEFLFVGTL